MSAVSDLPADRFFIGGAWVSPESRDQIEVISAGTEEVLGHVPAASEIDVDRAVQAARRAFDHGPWPAMTLAERTEILRRVSDAYIREREALASLISAEMGCPITLARTMQASTPKICLDTAIDVATRFPFEEAHRSGSGNAILVREPVGVVAVVVPWNSPQTSAIVKIAPALLAGCTVVLKPAPETAFDALILVRMLTDAGMPDGVVNLIQADRGASAALVAHPGVDKVAFTGSTAAGRRIAAQCGHDLRRVTLELGGKSAAVILEDADLESAVEALRTLSLRNTGQVCTNNTRILVAEELRAELTARLIEMVAGMKVGDPSDPLTEVGPLVTRQQRERVEGYIRSGIDQGARLLTGGGRPRGLDRGWFVEPTVFGDVDNGMTIAREEIFGPVLSIIGFRGDEQAIGIANDSPYGLAGSVFSADEDRALSVAAGIRSGAVYVNGVPPGLEAPFGGVKSSGLGRENGFEGLSGYVETKSIGVRPGLLDAWEAREDPETSGVNVNQK